MEYKEIVEKLDRTIGISYMLGFPWQVEFYKAVKKELEETRKRAEKAEKERDEIFTLFNDLCKDVRERNVDDSVCHFCEYDGTYMGENGEWVNECPGFEKNDCFCMKKTIEQKYGKKEE